MGLPTPLARVLDAVQGAAPPRVHQAPGGPVAVGAAARAHRVGRAAGLVVRQVRRQARDDGDQPPRVLPAARRGRGAARRRLRRLRRRHRRRLQRDVRHRPRPLRHGRRRARSRSRVRRPRRPGRPAGVRRRRGLPGGLGAAVRTAAQRGAAHGGDPRQGGRPPAGDGAARQPRLVRRVGFLPPQLLRVLGAARRAVGGRGAHRGAPSDQRDDVGGWGAFQSRSYFAVQLSPRWWLWAWTASSTRRSTPSSCPTSGAPAGASATRRSSSARRRPAGGGRARGHGDLLRRGRQPALHPPVVHRPRAGPRRAPPDPARPHRRPAPLRPLHLHRTHAAARHGAGGPRALLPRAGDVRRGRRVPRLHPPPAAAALDRAAAVAERLRRDSRGSSAPPPTPASRRHGRSVAPGSSPPRGATGLRSRR